MKNYSDENVSLFKAATFIGRAYVLHSEGEKEGAEQHMQWAKDLFHKAFQDFTIDERESEWNNFFRMILDLSYDTDVNRDFIKEIDDLCFGYD